MNRSREFKGLKEISHEILCFRLGQTEFGISMLKLFEVVNYVEILRVEDDGLIEGVINYRGVVTPVIDVRKALRFPPVEYSLDAHIIITDVGGDKVGLVVDNVRDVLTISDRVIEKPGSRIPHSPFLSGVAKLDDRMLLILDVNRLMERTHVASFKSEGILPTDTRDPRARTVLQQRARELSRPTEEADGDDQEILDLVHFALGDGEFVVKTDYTKEIVTPPHLAPIPCTAPYVLGAINIRGVIMPVIDLAILLGVGETSAESSLTRLIVTCHENDHIGLLVDRVFGLCSIASSEIAPPIIFIEDETARFIEGEFDLDERALCMVRMPAVFRHLEEQ